MRADVNLSVREKGMPGFGTRTEMKNLGSFRAVTRAIESERARQVALLESGERVLQETRRWDESKGQKSGRGDCGERPLFSCSWGLVIRTIIWGRWSRTG